MIQSKRDLKYYIEQDALARGISQKSLFDKFKQSLSPVETWVFQKRLRKLEYYLNCKKDFVSKIYIKYLRYRFKKISLKLGYSIPPNVFGPGLCILHYGTIVVNSRAKIGKNCRMEVCVNIGASGGKQEAPQMGDNIYIAPGVKIYGDIRLGNNIAIGANSTVNKSFEENNILIAGSPAKKIKEIDIKRIIKHI
ncbi:MAG: serine acetyltransferase [Pseudozobellia sp.]|nr:serine acetyltransferase [Pseudozobellia sp.]MBG50371.1 serine acetyltransferase [Pseudozobellia sp.]|tara:strand:- start:93 stop:674 length:582 start_codon:yes stop_codon:yes gene_type:complete